MRGFTDFGVLADANEPMRSAPAERFVIEDVDVADVSRPVPGSSDGRAEACLWVGDSGIVRRARLRSCAWTGLWTGTAARGARFERVDVDGTRTGVYLEHFTYDSTFPRLRVGADVRIGLNAEWAAPAWGGKPASVGNVIEDSHFESRARRRLPRRGHHAHDRSATARSRASGGRPIGDYRGRDNAFHDNDYRGIAAGAEQVSRRAPHLGQGGISMTLVSPTPTTAIETITTATAFEGLAGEWDGLVRAMPRPSPFLLHGWLAEWWRHYCDGATSRSTSPAATVGSSPRCRSSVAASRRACASRSSWAGAPRCCPIS